MPKDSSAHSSARAQPGEETQQGGVAPARGRQRRGGWPRGRCSRCLYLGPQGPGTGRMSPACSVPPAAPPPPHRGVPRGAGTVCSRPPGKDAQARCVPAASEGVFPAWANGLCVHTCSQAQQVLVSPANPQGGQELMGESSVIPPKVQGTLLTHPSGEREPRRERWQQQRAGKLLNQEDKRRTLCYTRSILNLAAPTTLP